MPLATGTKLGHYEILAPVGAGGMGDVYRARDPRLNRYVAIKISRERFSDRFMREARAVAALNHPNICTLYDVGPTYLVMELIEGESPRGPLPLEEALRIARQIADALEAAHERGIVHRDLKPANIKIKPDGTVKVLDFGLAKTAEIASAAPESSTTMTNSPTRTGMILGTAAYMPPEQARGKAVDKRADIWAFGVVLYEMLTGRLPFPGEDLAEIVASVVKEEPRLEAIPPQVRRLVKSCLEKDPRKRLRDIGDAWRLLEEAPLALPSRTNGARGPWMAWLAATVLLGGLAAWGWLRTTPLRPGSVTRWTIPLASTSTIPAAVALSRDGTRLAYVEGQGSSHIMLRMMDQLEAKPIPGGDNGDGPSFSPDGRWVIYTVGASPSKVNKIPVIGGTPLTLCNGSTVAGASWGDDDTIVLGGGAGKGLLRCAAAGGVSQTLTAPDTKRGETAHRYPQWLPGGQAVLFTISSGTDSDTDRVAVLDLIKGGYRVLVNGGSDARYIPTGHLVYIRGGTLFGVSFDLKRMAVTGAEISVVEGIASRVLSGSADYAFADSGLLVYRPRGLEDVHRSIVWADLAGNKQQPVNVPPQNYRRPHVSPDGGRAVVEIAGGGSGKSDVWIVDLVRGALMRLTSEGSNIFPIWTPDGRRVAFMSQRAANSGIYWSPADGSGKPELLLATETVAVPSAWTPDGQTLFFYQRGADAKAHIWILPAPGGGGESKPRAFLQSSFNEMYMVSSPDGRWVAYQSDETGRYETYVQPFPGLGGKTLISMNGGQAPHWYGRKIFFRTAADELAVVEVESSPTFHAGHIQNLFKPIRLQMWDVAPDGKRALLIAPPDTPAEGRRLEAVVNWFDEVRRRARAFSGK